MSTFITVFLFTAGGFLLLYALKPLFVHLRNLAFRMYLGFRPLYALQIFEEWYPKLNAELSSNVSLQFVPVPWTVMEAIKYGTEQSRTLSSLLAPTLDSKTTVAKSTTEYLRTVGTFENAPLEKEVSAQEMFAQIRELRRPKKNPPSTPDASSDEMIEKIVNKLGPEIEKLIRKQRLKVADDDFRRAWEEIKNCQDFKSYLKRKIEAFMKETGGTEETRRELENLANQHYMKFCSQEEDE